MAENTQKNTLLLSVSCEDEAKSVAPCSLQEAFMILSKYRSQTKHLTSVGEASRLQSKTSNEASFQMGGGIFTSNSQALSAVSIVRIASKIDSDLIDNRHKIHLQRVLRLLDAAEKFVNREYDEAEESLDMLLVSVSHVDHHPIERVITCFARDLRERTECKKGRIDLEREATHVDLEQAMINLSDAIYSCEQKLAITQISHFTAIQTILDSVAPAERVHFVDIGKNLGPYWIVMMHALASRESCKLKELKITVICKRSASAEQRGKLLCDYAKSVKLPFMLEILDELERDRLMEIEAGEGEVVAVYMELCLVHLSKNTVSLLGILKNLNPHLIVINDVEVNTTASSSSSSSSSLIDNFKDALLLCSAVFDGLEDCLEHDDNEYRQIAEKHYFQEIISKGVLSEEDNHRLKIDYWRDYFSRFGMMEIELSLPAIYQASLMIRGSPSWSSCALSMNGKSMLIGWNGIPLRFVSAWRFQQDSDHKRNS